MKRFILMAALAAASFSAPAQAGIREDVLAGATRCGAITDDRKWLDCFYGSAQPMRGQLGLAPAPAAQTGLVPSTNPGSPPPAGPAPASQRSQPQGFFGRMLGGQVVVNNAPVSDYSFDRAGYFTVTLANGQVWRQEDNAQPAHWTKPAKQYLATVNQGALNSYNLSISGDNNVYKVRRLQ